MSKDSNAGFFTGLVIGALIGAAISLLYAPQSGVETRRVVKDKIGVARDTVSKTAGRVKETVATKIKQAEE
ncbi:MAG: YtxH domain-containing protein [Dehalococcoidia bacterium]|nr:YtxH domain-containing protein [Dehalococcoidia bacterium]